MTVTEPVPDLHNNSGEMSGGRGDGQADWNLDAKALTSGPVCACVCVPGVFVTVCLPSSVIAFTTE